MVYTRADAENYRTESEMAQLTQLVNAYLDVAESMALRSGRLGRPPSGGLAPIRP